MGLPCLVRVLLLLALFSSELLAEEPIVVKHYQHQARYAFGVSVLDLALSKLGQPYEIVTPGMQHANEARGEMLVIDGSLDLEFLSTTVHRESVMIPVKVPIYRGLLGLRLLLVKPSKNARLSEVRNLEDLRQYVGGHGAHWGDLPVYAANDLRVVTSVIYENLFEMLNIGRFDYFHRGISEIWGELENHPNQFVVADKVMLFYPHPVYFFVSKHRPVLAKQIQQGLDIAINDGSYKALFQENYIDAINRSDLSSRTLINLKNPVVPPNTESIDTSWWLPNDRLLQ